MPRVVELDAGATHRLRQTVLRAHLPEAGVENPEDDLPGTVHLGVVEEDGRLSAVATLFPEPTEHRPGWSGVRLRGMAVDPERQGHGLGSLLLDAVVDRARRDGHRVLWANGRDTALDFYTRRGWEVVGEGFTSVGLPHHVVVLDL